MHAHWTQHEESEIMKKEMTFPQRLEQGEKLVKYLKDLSTYRIRPDSLWIVEECVDYLNWVRDALDDIQPVK